MSIVITKIRYIFDIRRYLIHNYDKERIIMINGEDNT